MIIPVHQRLRERLAATLETLYHLSPGELPPLALEYPPRRELGDLATPAAFELAEADDDIGHLHAGVVDVVLHFDR